MRRFLLAGLVFTLGGAAQAQAPQDQTSHGQAPGGRDAGVKTVTLIQSHDSHGQLIPHWQPFQRPGEKTATWHPDSGGWAKRYTLVQQIRREHPASLLILHGDNFFGGAELLFTRGEALVPIVNAFDVAAYVPGNWDFANGPEPFRKLFTGPDKLVNFPVLDIHTRNAPGGPGRAGERVMEPYVIRDVGGVKVAIIGCITDKVADQAAARGKGFIFGGFYEELPKFIREVRAKGAEVVVLATEAQLSQAVALARDVPGLDVVMGSDTHETLYAPIRVAGTNTLVVESGEDTYLGELNLQVQGGKVVGHQWTLHEIDETVPQDPGIKKLVDEARAPFLSGPQFRPHVREMPGWEKGTGLRLSEPLDTVVGRSDTDLQRHHVLERVVDNFIVDALLDATGADIAVSNGFRYDVPIKAGEPITLGEVFRYLPLAGHVGVAGFTGGQLLERFERFLGAVLDPNPYRRTGGWVPAVAGIRFQLDLAGPNGPALDRILKAEVYDRKAREWRPLEEDRVYTMASCYSPGDPLDHVCRTHGARDLKILLDDYRLVEPLVHHQPAPPGKPVKVAPDNFMSATDLVRGYLKKIGGVVRGAEHRVGRWQVVNGELPVSVVSPLIVQPLQGAGPGWLAAPRLKTEGAGADGAIRANPGGL